MAVVNEIVTLFKYEGSTAPLSNYNESLKESIAIAAKVAAGVAAAAGGIYYFTTSTLDGVDALNQLSRETDTSIERLQELGYIASVNGSSIDDVKQSVAALSEAIGRAANGDKSYADIFTELGISIRDSKGEMKDATRVIYDLNEAFNKKGLSKQEQAGYLKKLRLNRRMIQMLGLERKEMDRLAKSARNMGIVSREQADATSEMFDAITTAKFAIGSIANEAALMFVPAITSMANAVVPAIDFIGRISHIINVAVDSTIGWDNAFYGLTAAALYFNRATIAAFATNPLFIIGATITAVLLAIDDLYVAFKGGKSVIRDWVKEWTGWDIGEGMRNAYDAVVEYFGKIKQFIDDTIGAIKKMWDDMINGIVSALNAITPDMSGTPIPASSVVDNAATTAIKNPVQLSGGTTVNNVNIDIKTNDPHTVAGEVSDVFSSIPSNKAR